MAGKPIPFPGRRSITAPLTSSYPRSRLLEGLTNAETESILAAGVEQRVSANSVLVNQEHPADRLYLLMQGAARHFFITECGRKVLLIWLRPGDGFGGRALLGEPSSYLVSTETVKDSRVLVWPRNTFRALAAQYPRFWQNALSIASDYLAWFLAAHLALISQSARERLAHVVLSLAEGIGRQTSRGWELHITNEELANAANVTLFTASRVLSEWRRNGALMKSRGKIVLRSPQRLFLVPEIRPARSGTREELIQAGSLRVGRGVREGMSKLF